MAYALLSRVRISAITFADTLPSHARTLLACGQGQGARRAVPWRRRRRAVDHLRAGP